MQVSKIIESDQRGRVRLLFKLWSFVYDSALFQAPFFAQIHRRLLDRAAEVSIEPEAILDVGCGTAELLAKLHSRWPAARQVGVDLSPDMLSQGRQKLTSGQADLIEGSVFELPFAEGSFDLITNSISSHYYLDLERALSELARVCRPGGVLLMASMTNGPLRFVPGPWRGQISLWSSAYRSPGWQRAALEAAGFDVLRVDRVIGPAVLYVCRRRAARGSSS